jgi:hypothetical protein
MTVSVVDVLAEWGYSEVIDGIYASNYQVYGYLKTKRSQSVLFSELSRPERYELARACFNVRPSILIHLIGNTSFEPVNLTREELAKTFVPPHAAADLEGNYTPFEQYMNTHSDDPSDARYNRPVPQPWLIPETPLTFGYIYQHRVLLDGFHRAANFWRSNPAVGILRAYVPRDEPYTNR